MELIRAKPKRWGNSLGVVIPAHIVKQEQLTTETEVSILLMPKNYHPMATFKGILKTDKTVQQIMEEIDEGYDDP